MAKVRKIKGRWVVDYYLGRQRFRPSFQTKFQAEEFLRELKLRPVDFATGYEQLIEMSVGDASIDYLELVSKKKSTDTYSLEQGYFEKLSEYFDRCLISELKLIDIQKYQSYLRKSLCSSTVNRYFHTYRNFFRHCKLWKYTNTDPCENLKDLVEDVHVPKIFEDTQVQAVLNGLLGWKKDVTYFIAKTGVRRGEAVRLKRKDVDLIKGVVLIKSFKGGIVRVREVPLTTELCEFLKNHLESHNFEYVFVNDYGMPVNANKLTKKVTQVSQRVGLKGFGTKSLRHGIGSNLANANANLRKIQKLLGHSSMKTTEKYLHEEREALRADLQALEDKNVIRIDPRRWASVGTELKRRKGDAS